jgi:hypothetical protein
MDRTREVVEKKLKKLKDEYDEVRESISIASDVAGQGGGRLRDLYDEELLLDNLICQLQEILEEADEREAAELAND